MRKPSSAQIALFVGSVIVTGVALSQSTELPPVTVTGYAYDIYSIPPAGFWGGPQEPQAGYGPAQINSAGPTAHTVCTANTLSAALRDGNSSYTSQPNNTSWSLPHRTANPIDIAAGSSIAKNWGSTSSVDGVAVFPNIYDGTQAAIVSANTYASAGGTIYSLINTWAPPPTNPNAMTNTLADLGMTLSMAQATQLSALSDGEILEVIAAFAWQEGYKLPGC